MLKDDKDESHSEYEGSVLLTVVVVVFHFLPLLIIMNIYHAHQSPEHLHDTY